MNAYQIAFFAIGIISAGFFTLLGMSIFAGWVMGKIWDAFQDGKDLVTIQAAWRAYNEAKKEREAG